MISRWSLVDDRSDEAAAYARGLTIPGKLDVEPLSATAAKEAIGSGKLKPDGVLMDVDLSNETGMLDTGPGMAQSIRVAQNRQALPSFPIVRFSLRARVLENIGRDSSSDDIFDLKIDKDGISEADTAKSAQQKLIGVASVYEEIAKEFAVPTSLGLDAQYWQHWGHAAFEADVSRADRAYLIAGRLIRALVHPGMLIDETLLAFRLGINHTTSPAWPALLKSIGELSYSGISAAHFPRWWARGVESWWADLNSAGTPLAANTIEERHSILQAKFGDLAKLEMPRGSLGQRPWRFCLITFEEKGELIPVDPARAVKIAPRSALPSWLDPLYAALGPALRNPDYPGLDRSDLARLKLLGDRAS